MLGGNLGNELVLGLVLAASVHAYSADISIGTALLVNMGVSLYTCIIPVPGGIGVAEAGLTTALVAAENPEAQAFAAVLTFRLVTYYLPPVWGSSACAGSAPAATCEHPLPKACFTPTG